jgi:hypothetical protein
VVYPFKGVDMSLGGASGYTNFADPAQGGGGGKGGANLPSLIEQPLPQFTGDDPYSQIMAMTPAFRNPYANSSMGNALGGFDPSIYTRGMQGDAVTGGGGGGGGASPIMGGVGVGNAVTEVDPYDQAGQDAINKIEQEVAAEQYDQDGQDAINRYEQAIYDQEGADAVSRVEDAVREEALAESARASDIDAASYDDVQYQAPSYNYVSDAPATDVLAADAPTTDVPVYGGDFRGEMGGDLGGDDGQDMGEDSFDTAGYAKGGMIRGLLGPNPKGPDDGFAMVQRGEYVIKKSAVNKYGRGLLDMINEGKVPAKKIKSLLD